MNINRTIRRLLTATGTTVAFAAPAAPPALALEPLTPQAIDANATFLSYAPAIPGRPDMKVCVVDTGVDLTTDAAPAVVDRETVFPGGPVDDGGGGGLPKHGTYVAGVIASQANDADSVGIWPRAKIVSVRVFRDKASGTTASNSILPLERGHLAGRPEEIVQLGEASGGCLVAEGAVGSAAIVEVQPAGQGGVALGAVAVDGAVGPTAEHRSDEPLGLAVGLRAVRPGPQVADAQRATGNRVHGRAVGRAVVGDQLLDGDAVAREVLDGAAQEADGGDRLLVGEDLDVGQAGGVVDRDVHVFPADEVAAVPVGVGAAAGGASLARLASEPVPDTAVDASELLDVDVEQLARPGALVALGGLQPEASELAHPDPRQDPRHGRQRHSEQLSDLGAGEAQPPQRGDRLDAALVGAVGHDRRRRGTIQQPGRSARAVAGQPLARGVVADPGRLGGRAQRPPRDLDPLDQQRAALDAETGVTVQLHPVSSLGLLRHQPASKGHRMTYLTAGTTSSGTTTRCPSRSS